MFNEYFHGDNGAGLGACTRPGGPGWSPTSSGAVPATASTPSATPLGIADGRRAGMTSATTRPGSRFPLGATPTGDGTNFAVASSVADGMELCLFDDEGAESRVAADRLRRRRLARLRRRRRARAGLRLPRHRPVRPVAGLPRAIRPSCCSTRTPARPRRRHVRTGGARPRRERPRATERPRLGRVTCRAASSSTRRSTWTRRASAAAPPRRHRDLRGCTSRASPCRIRTCPPSCGAPTPAWRHDAVVSHLVDLGVTAVELLPGAPARARGVPRRARPHQLLGLQHHRLLRPARRATRPRCGPGSPVARSPSSRRMVEALHARRPRSDARRRVQPHGRGRAHSGPPCATAASTTSAYYRLDPNDLSPLRRHDRVRQLAQRRRLRPASS